MTKSDRLSKVVVVLCPLAVVYIAAVFLASTNDFVGDETTYVMFATNLANGHYSPKENINLWSGPGYPIVLAPFALLKLPWITAKLVNAFLLFAAVVYFARTLRLYINETPCWILSFLLR